MTDFETVSLLDLRIREFAKATRRLHELAQQIDGSDETIRAFASAFLEWYRESSELGRMIQSCRVLLTDAWTALARESGKNPVITVDFPDDTLDSNYEPPLICTSAHQATMMSLIALPLWLRAKYFDEVDLVEGREDAVFYAMKQHDWNEFVEWGHLAFRKLLRCESLQLMELESAQVRNRTTHSQTHTALAAVIGPVGGQVQPNATTKDKSSNDFVSGKQDGSSWEEIAAKLEKKRQKNEAYTSQPKLAKEFHCSSATINKAISNTPSLRGWAQSKSGAPNVVGLTAATLSSQHQCREDDPSNIVEEADIDNVMARLIQQAQPNERAQLHSMSDEQRRELAKIVLDDPDRGRKVYSRK